MQATGGPDRRYYMVKRLQFCLGTKTTWLGLGKDPGLGENRYVSYVN